MDASRAPSSSRPSSAKPTKGLVLWLSPSDGAGDSPANNG
jgi:hypothetical protein